MTISRKRLAGFLAAWIVVLLVAGGVPIASADTFTAPAGSNDYQFNVEFELTDSRQFAGVHIDLTVSDIGALQLTGFEIISGSGSPDSINPVSIGNTYAFGFFTDSNNLQGTYAVRLKFIYSGSVDQTITIDRVALARYSEENPLISEWLSIMSNYATHNVTRSSGGPGGGNDPGGNGGGSQGGTAGGDSPSVITIDDEGPPLAEFPERSSYFVDVVARHFWAIEAIDTLYEMGIVHGTSPNPLRYSPDLNIKRGDFVLMIARAFELKAETDGNFPDVPKGSYYYDAIAVAKALGIVEGYGIDFKPERFISRQEMMAVIDRTLTAVGMPLPQAPLSVLDSFTDRDKIAGYALNSAAALVQAGIIRGDDTRINPRDFTTRAQMAVVVFRLVGPQVDLL